MALAKTKLAATVVTHYCRRVVPFIPGILAKYVPSHTGQAMTIPGIVEDGEIIPEEEV